MFAWPSQSRTAGSGTPPLATESRLRGGGHADAGLESWLACRRASRPFLSRRVTYLVAENGSRGLVWRAVGVIPTHLEDRFEPAGNRDDALPFRLGLRCEQHELRPRSGETDLR